MKHAFFLPPHMRFAVKNVKRIWWKDQREGRVWTAVMLDTHGGWKRRFRNNLITHTHTHSRIFYWSKAETLWGRSPPLPKHFTGRGHWKTRRRAKWCFHTSRVLNKNSTTQTSVTTAETPTHRLYCESFRKWVTQACLILTLMPLLYEPWYKFTAFLLTVYDLWTADHMATTAECSSCTACKISIKRRST